MIVPILLVMTFVVWGLRLWVAHLIDTREVIAAHGEDYLHRYFIWKPKSKGLGRIYLHHILRSDGDRAKHSHPWNFTSLILAGGYFEVADIRQASRKESWTLFTNRKEVIKWFGTGSFLKRGAGWRHRLILPKGKTAWTLVHTSGKVREWGFYLDDDRFCHNTKYDNLTGLCDD